MQLFEMTWPQVDDLSPWTPVVIPVAALEQHGPHMPVFTDSLLLGEIMRRLEERMSERVLFTPLMWLGNSEHHLDYPGTMTAAPRTYLDLLKDMTYNMLSHGFRTIVLINGGTSVQARAGFAGTSVAFPAESAYGQMLHDALADEGVRVVQLEIPGSIPKLQIEGGVDGVAERIWQLHTTPGQFRTMLIPLDEGRE